MSRGHMRQGVPYVTGVSYPPVRVLARENRRPNPQISRKTDWNAHGILAVFAVLSAAVAADGGALLLAAWLTR